MYKLVEKDKQTTEQEVFLAIKEKADITYFQYAINVNGVEKTYLKTEEEAKQILEVLLQEFGEDIDVSISKVYTKNLQIEEELEIATISSAICEEVEEEKKKEEATINGVYLSVNPISRKYNLKIWCKRIYKRPYTSRPRYCSSYRNENKSSSRWNCFIFRCNGRIWKFNYYRPWKWNNELLWTL